MNETHDGGGGLPAAIRRFERATGLYRPGRSPWVWIGPGVNVVGSLVMIGWVGIAYDLGWAATIPTAVVLSLFMGIMSAAFLANWEDDAEEDERRADEALSEPNPPGGSGSGVSAPPEPPLRPAGAALPAEPAAATARDEHEVREPEPVGR
ncbi:MAG TPA: hypothetical protein VFO60_00590 [Candidatus Dormibacteraeota bacterium]|nr:hypothetical protein [Candidatus Dormibacteraeota bacterium]